MSLVRHQQRQNVISENINNGKKVEKRENKENKNRIDFVYYKTNL